MRTNLFFLRTKRIGRATAFAFAAAMVLALLLGLQSATKPAHAADTFTVDRSDDPDLSTTPTADDCAPAEDNDCSLRGAITAANNTSGADTINFNIGGGSGVKTILPDSDLPIITEAVTINGYSQPGASPNTNDVLAEGTDANLLIELNEGSIGLSSNGLIRINAPDVVVKGLVLKCFNTGIFIQSGGSRAVIEGNFIGNPSSVCSVNDGVVVSGDNNTIGGQEPAARNLISGNSSEGLSIGGTGGNKIQGNLIGTKANGIEGMGNHDGVEIASPNNTVGNSTVDNEAGANLIAFNGANGVLVFRTPGFSAGNRILSNSIHSNGGPGIDLTASGVFSPDGVTANDSRDKDTGANNLQNFPKITSSATTTASGGTTTIKGKLNSRPRKTFTLQFFSSPELEPSGNVEGKTLLRTLTNVRTNRKGVGSFSFQVSTDVSGQYITATATDASGNTSEFSKGCQVPKRTCP